VTVSPKGKLLLTVRITLIVNTVCEKCVCSNVGKAYQYKRVILCLHSVQVPWRYIFTSRWPPASSRYQEIFDNRHVISHSINALGAQRNLKRTQ